MIRSDAAVIILNFYPPAVVRRAVDSVMRQDYGGTWTVYLGFHCRSREHQDAVREQLRGLPVEYVDIPKDLVSDTRAKNVILQHALAAGEHRYLFFLDDDDEWHPDYLRKMTARCRNFVTCGKEVLTEETGERRTVLDDVDYEGMGFSFSLWKGKALPWFVKQVCDKYILREFSEAFPDHRHIAEPLYTIHQHGTSLTYTLAMGRDAGKAKAAKPVRRIGAVLPAGAPEGLARIARAPGIEAVSPRTLQEDSRFDALIAGPGFWKARPDLPAGTLKVAFAETYGELPAARAVGADAVFPSEPLWIRDLPEYSPVIPVGIPSSVPQGDVKRNAAKAAGRAGTPKRCFFTGGDAARGILPPGWEPCSRIEDADACVDLTPEKTGWCPGILDAFVLGIPCVSYPFSSAHQILFGASGLSVRNPEEVRAVLERFDAGAQRKRILRNLRLYSRCYEPFFWFNFLTRYLEAERKP